MTTLGNRKYIENIIDKLEACRGDASTIHRVGKYITLLNGALQLSSLYPDSVYNTDKYTNNLLDGAKELLEEIGKKL